MPQKIPDITLNSGQTQAPARFSSHIPSHTAIHVTGPVASRVMSRSTI